METVATREWVIREVDPDGIVVQQVPDGGSARLAPGLLPDDVSEGDRFQVVAQVDRRGPRDAPGAPGGGASVPDGGEPAGPAGDRGDGAHGQAGTGAGAAPGEEGVPADDPRAAGRDADDGPFEVPDAMREALRNLT